MNGMVAHNETRPRQCRVEPGLVASESRYRRLFEAARDGILILDAVTGQIVDVNPYLLELMGYSYRELVGRHLWEIGPFEDARASRKSFEELKTVGYVRYENLPLRARDGRTVAVEFVSNVYRVDGEDVIQCNIRDVSVRQQGEALREQLASAVLQQLEQAQRMEGVGLLASGVAHDVNNLLSVILACADFALEGVPEDDPRRADLLQVKKAGQIGAALTRQLLTLGRNRATASASLDLNAVVGGAEKMLLRIGGADVALVQTLAPDLGRVTADASQLELVLMNLAVNAHDAMPAGGTLTIETTNVELDASFAAAHAGLEPGRYVMLAVGDTGIGMDEQTQARIFEPFFTTKEIGKGTGLGLSTVRGILSKSGGIVTVASELGAGTIFRIYLPREPS